MISRSDSANSGLPSQAESSNNWQLDDVPQYHGLLERFVLKKKLTGSKKSVLFLAKYKAADKPEGDVILKILAPDLAASEVARFKREYKGISAIKHQNVVQYHEIGTTGQGGPDYIAMEAVPGSDLQRIMQMRKVLQQNEAVGVLRGVLRALSALHARGIVHRDVKPANVMLSPSSPFIKLIDFGFARFMEVEKEGKEGPPPEESQIIGTPLFWAPEQTFPNAMVAPTMDLWAVGVLTHYLISGTFPYSQSLGLRDLARSIRNDAPRDILSVLPRGQPPPVHLVTLVRRTMAKDPSLRPQTAEHCLHMIRPLAERRGGDGEQLLENLTARTHCCQTGVEALKGALGEERARLEQLLRQLQSLHLTPSTSSAMPYSLSLSASPVAGAGTFSHDGQVGVA